MIDAAKKTYLKDKAEESWLKNGTGERKRKKREEESEGLRSTGSKKYQRIIEQNR